VSPDTRLLYVATTNAHKAQEIAAILAPRGWRVEVPLDLPHVVEDGTSFIENARIKARAGAAHLGAPVLAEDSGLAVACLDGAPGIHSARYAGEHATDADNNALLIERLKALGVSDPAAAFVSTVCVVDAEGAILAEAEGRVEGTIRWPARGEGGFGYDPYFFHPPSNCHMAELDAEAKNRLSHRGRALQALVPRLSR